ncbi:hypothetical protein ACVWYQ_004875 [Bradyrhizobium sp. USDA 3397]
MMGATANLGAIIPAAGERGRTGRPGPLTFYQFTTREAA